MDNFFIVTDHALVTPPTATNLKGVTRETLLGARREPRHPGRGEAVHAVRGLDGDAKRSSAGPAPKSCRCVSVDDRTIGNGTIGPVTGRIVAAYHQLVRSQGTPIQPRRRRAR